MTTTGNEITFGEGEFIVSKTDLKGKITYGNELFIQISGYTELELLGAPHSILRHPDMPKCAFKLVWETIQQGEEIFALVKNLAKNGNHYWVKAHVTPSFDTTGQIIGYHSVRRKPSQNIIKTIEPLYKILLQEEQKGGMNAGYNKLLEILSKEGVTYEQFIFAL